MLETGRCCGSIVLPDGSETGAAIRREPPSATVIRTFPTFPNCGNIQHQPGQPGVRRIVVLDVVGFKSHRPPQACRS